MAEGFSPAKKPRLDENKDHEHIIEAGSAGPPSTSSNRIATKLLEIEGVMCRELEDIAFGPPVTHIYNPLDYAAIPHRDYVSRYGNTPKKILFLGMNPGPFGMAQNGVCVMSGSEWDMCLHGYASKSYWHFRLHLVIVRWCVCGWKLVELSLSQQWNIPRESSMV